MKRIVFALMLLAGVGAMVPVADTYAAAIKEPVAEECEKTLFGMRPWYAGLVTKDNNQRCVVGTPTEETMAAFVWTVVLNLLFDAFTVLGIVSTGFIILGGYWYLRSGGDPSLVDRGKKTIQAAVIGTVIALIATLITNFVTTILMSGR